MVNVVDTTKEPARELNQVKIVQEFPDVFLEDLPGLPPTREMELLPGNLPISKAPYIMAPMKLQELRSSCKN